MSVEPTPAKVIQPLDVDYDAIRSSTPHRMVHGVEAWLIRLRQQVINVLTAVQAYRSPAGIRAVIARLKEHRALASGGKRVVKLVNAAGRNYWRLFIPANTSPLHVPFLKGELNRFAPHSRGGHELAVVFLSVTKKCPLKCEHCFEWDNLNQKEVIGPEDINCMIENLQSMGATNIAFTGGEPMLRVREMAESIRRYKSRSQFWILTSGFNFTAANAAELRRAGAHGVVVSIDHYDPLAHDQFRGIQGSFRDAITAVKHALDQGYLTAISTCVTRENANRKYIDAFMGLAKSLGVGFVQWIEPKAIGHYAMQDVLLKPEHKAVLEEALLDYTYTDAYKNHPLVIYHEYYQRKLGCFAAGNKMVYVDTDGDLMSCPFCHRKGGSLLGDDFRQSLENLRTAGCSDYGPVMV